MSRNSCRRLQTLQRDKNSTDVIVQKFTYSYSEFTEIHKDLFLVKRAHRINLWMNIFFIFIFFFFTLIKLKINWFEIFKFSQLWKMFYLRKDSFPVKFPVFLNKINIDFYLLSLWWLHCKWSQLLTHSNRNTDQNKSCNVWE